MNGRGQAARPQPAVKSSANGGLLATLRYSVLLVVAILAANPVGEQVVRTNGGVDAAMTGLKKVKAYYTYGLVAHGQLEPMNCTA